MKLLLSAAMLLLMAGCADINWQQTAKNSMESACRGSSNCHIE